MAKMEGYQAAGLIKIWSRLGTQFMAFFRLIALISTFRDKKYRILTFCDKTESDSLSGSLWLSLALSLALSGSLSGSL